MKKRLFLVFLLIFLICVFSCDRADFSINDVQAQPYITSDGIYGLSLYMLPSVHTADIVALQVYSPDNILSWSLIPVEEKFNNLTFIGTSSVSMPKGVELPQGEWKFVVTIKDGRSIEKSFRVSYADARGALERNIDTTTEVFDIISNITVIPKEEK